MQTYLQFCSRKDRKQGLMSETIEYLNFFLKPSMASWPPNWILFFRADRHNLSRRCYIQTRKQIKRTWFCFELMHLCWRRTLRQKLVVDWLKARPCISALPHIAHRAHVGKVVGVRSRSSQLSQPVVPAVDTCI